MGLTTAAASMHSPHCCQAAAPTAALSSLLLQERMDAIRREQDAAEVKECSFRPQLNSRSMRMVEQRQEILRVRVGGC